MSAMKYSKLSLYQSSFIYRLSLPSCHQTAPGGHASAHLWHHPTLSDIISALWLYWLQQRTVTTVAILKLCSSKMKTHFWLWTNIKERVGWGLVEQEKRREGDSVWAHRGKKKQKKQNKINNILSCNWLPQKNAEMLICVILVGWGPAGSGSPGLGWCSVWLFWDSAAGDGQSDLGRGAGLWAGLSRSTCGGQ